MIYPELSYKLVGLLFEVQNQLEKGFREKTYQEAISHILKENKIPFKEQLESRLSIKEKVFKKYFADFLIDGKIILEIKTQERFLRENIAQIYEYLKTNNLRLGIIANFTKQGVKFKRIIYKG